MRRGMLVSICLALVLAAVSPPRALSWTPLPIADDALVWMPGTQPDQGVDLQEPVGCINCHGETTTDASGNTVVPGQFWSGSMMAQSARDPLFWAAMTVAGQDSVWVLGNPNAADICERCHMPEGWLGGRSDPANASLMTGSDFDGVHCDACHRMWNPFYAPTDDGTREGSDWTGYWDEAGPLSAPAAAQTLLVDQGLAAGIQLFSGQPFFLNDLPRCPTYVENGGGQYFIDPDNAFSNKRASFADTVPDHTVLYSRYHKSKFFCSSCHDVSNPVLANLGHSGLPDLSGGADLITEQYPASNYFHVERTFSEFMLSAYGQPGGAPTNPEFQAQGAAAVPAAAKCQDCHMRDVQGKGCREAAAPLRPDDSTEHPNSGAPLHDLQGGNLWITSILASLDDHLPATFDQVNFDLLSQGPQALTLNILSGISPTDNGDALLAAAERARQQLLLAATFRNISYTPAGDLSFQILNNTGHKLISGFPEGRRMFVNIKVYDAADNLILEGNPYDAAAGTLRGLAHPSSPALAPKQAYVDELVYEEHSTSTLTGEQETFHFVLATGVYKDNRIPPKGFDIVEAATRKSLPAWHGVDRPDLFTAAESAGGYDDVTLPGFLPAGSKRVALSLMYQGTSREYVEFLRDEINGTGTTLASPTPSGEPRAYIIQADPFFSGLKAWGTTIWELWRHNHGLDGLGVQLPGIVPFEMANAALPDITVTRPNAVADAYAATERVPLVVSAPGVLGNDTDINGDPLTAVLVSGPANPNATLRFNANGSFTYTLRVPIAGRVVDTFTYKASDGLLDSLPAVVTIAVNPGPTPARLRLYTPNGGESIAGGSTYRITWDGPLVHHYRLQYSLNGGTTWTNIRGALRLPRLTRFFNWTTPNPPTNRPNCLVRVLAYNAANRMVGSDTSNGPFRIRHIP